MRKLLKLFTISLLLMIAVASCSKKEEKEEKHTNRVCGSVLDFEKMKETDPERYQRFMDYEEQLQNLLNQLED
jgi:hypothetical protein